MIRTAIFAVALALTASPAMATDFSLQSGINTEGNAWFVAPHISNGGYSWNPVKQIVEILPTSFNHTLKFNIAQDSDISFNLWQSEPGITFDNILLNGVSLASNLTGMIGANPGFSIGTSFANAGQVTLQFIGTNVGNPHSFGGNLNVKAALAPAVPEPATWAMMLIGLGTVGYAMRNSKKTISFA